MAPFSKQEQQKRGKCRESGDRACKDLLLSAIKCSLQVGSARRAWGLLTDHIFCFCRKLNWISFR